MTQLTKQLTVRQKLVVILALLYFLSPIRLIINLIPIIGDLADIFVILCVIATFRDSLLAAVQSTNNIQKTISKWIDDSRIYKGGGEL